jgi:hypothetical protein
VACAFASDPGCVALSTRLFHRALPAAERIDHPRALAFALVGIHAYLMRFSGDTEVRRVRVVLAERLYGRFVEACRTDWPWYDATVTYANAKIPQALLLSGQWLQRADMLKTGLHVLDWLVSNQTENGRFSPVGNDGWLVQGAGKARFDQQPIEAQAMVEACLLASRMTRRDEYAAAARRAFDWFLGHNDLNVALYDHTTGGCRDGLQPNGPNYNQGAESTLAWLMALISMHGFEADQKRLSLVE